MPDLSPVDIATFDPTGSGDIKRLGSRDIVDVPPAKPPTQDVFLLPSREDRKYALSIATQRVPVADGVAALIAAADTILDYVVRGSNQSV